MPLPDWAQPPEPGFEHGDNYSVLEVVWTHPDGRVTIQFPPEELGPEEPLEAILADQPPPRRRLLRRRARD